MQILIASYMMISFMMNLVVGVIGIFAFIELRSFMKSTHKVEFIPLDHKAEPGKEPLRDQDLNEYDL